MCHESHRLKNQNAPSEDSIELTFEAVHCRSNLLQLRFGILRRCASFLSIPPEIISQSPDTFSAAIYLQNVKSLDNEFYSYLIVAELFNIEIKNNNQHVFQLSEFY